MSSPFTRRDVCEYQLFADRMSPFEHTVVLGHINGSVSYVGTRKDYELPGLTGGHGIAPHRGLLLEPVAEEMIQEGVNRLLNELKAACK